MDNDITLYRFTPRISYTLCSMQVAISWRQLKRNEFCCWTTTTFNAPKMHLCAGFEACLNTCMHSAAVVWMLNTTKWVTRIKRRRRQRHRVALSTWRTRRLVNICAHVVHIVQAITAIYHLFNSRRHTHATGTTPTRLRRLRLAQTTSACSAREWSDWQRRPFRLRARQVSAHGYGPCEWL
jgi:hypothetical protein